jgi:hypothetical protein
MVSHCGKLIENKHKWHGVTGWLGRIFGYGNDDRSLTTSGLLPYFLLDQKVGKKSRLIFFFYGFNRKIFIRRSLRTLRSLAAPSAISLKFSGSQDEK